MSVYEVEIKENLTRTVYTRVEAGSEEEAERKALSGNSISEQTCVDSEEINMRTFDGGIELEG